MRLRPATVAALILAAMIALAGILVPTHAFAAPGQFATCPTGNQVTSYSPPMTNTPTLTTGDIHTDFGPCVSSDLTLLTGSMDVHYTRIRSCTDPLSSGPNDFTIHWNNGKSSYLDLEATRSYVNGNFVMVVTGVVASGEFQGNKVVGELVLATFNQVACTTTGVTQTEGNFTISILPV
ncbi:hypothetical protein OV450_8505 [Actinobacteria bacterium OV450]|nr:hypothetical protein OV450_8505 [Actinobacteria bacterium OV450]